ncbi:MAG: type VI secretion system contractile sheath large subunit [Myxococcota bacterium]
MAQEKLTNQAQTVTTTAPKKNRGNLLDEILNANGLAVADENRQLVKRGLEQLLKQVLVSNEGEEAPRVDRARVDAAIAEIDKQLSRQVDKILHNQQFQKIESSWRGLNFLVNRTDFRQNIQVSVLNVTKDELRNDFLDSPDITFSGLYQHIYTAEYGTHGGSPFAAIIGNYDFGPSAPDVNLLRSISAVSAVAHAPFISAAGPQFFGLESFEGLPKLKDLKSIFEQPQYTAWRSLRESEDSRYIGLTCPRFLLRMPYGDDNPVKAFNYQEDVSGSHESYLWGNTSFAFSTRLTDSFAQYGWCPNIIGPKGGGQVDELPVHLFRSLQGDLATKIPTEVLISEPREVELADSGFIALTMRKGSDNACFFSANSIQKPKYFGQSPEGKNAETNYKLGTQLPYLFVVSRLAHYVKVLQREAIGSFKERMDLEKELNQWIRQYVSDMDSPQPGVRARKPLRQAKITVDTVAGEPGWYKVDMKVVPHIKYMGAFFTLSLVGKLDTK